MTIKNSDITLEEWQREFVQNQFDEGLRSSNLGDQPAPWLLRGLQILEAGEKLTAQRIDDFNRAGGTDHPDPWVVY